MWGNCFKITLDVQIAIVVTVNYDLKKILVKINDLTIITKYLVEGFGNFPLITSGRVTFKTWKSMRNSTLENNVNISVSLSNTPWNLYSNLT
jgi:hypothetical protein